MSALVLILFAANYFMVDQRLDAGMVRTPYNDVRVISHFGAFIQPSVVVIHVWPADSKKLTEANFTDFLVALAHNTPTNVLTNDLFQRVALTSRWTAEYSFSGYSWKQLGDMQQDDATARRDFILAQVSDAGGDPLLPPSSMNEAAQEERRDKVWKDFVDHFVAKPEP
jgi:hypothetical protein